MLEEKRNSRNQNNKNWWHKFHRLVCLFTSLLFCFFSLVKSQQFSIRKYTIEDGLPTNNIFKSYEDSFGYLWIGTNNGLSRFDGKNFINYGIANGLPSLKIDVIFEDSQHRLWVGTRSGMARLINDRFVTYPLSDDLPLYFTFGIRESRDGQVWAFTSHGIYQFQDSLWQKIKLFPGYDNRPCRQMVTYNSDLIINYGDRIVIRNSTGVWKVIAENETAYPFFNLLSVFGDMLMVNTRDSIYQIRDDHLIPLLGISKGFAHFVYLRDSKKNIWYIHQEGDTVFSVLDVQQFSAGKAFLPNSYDIISNLSEDSHGNIWVATSGGLLKIRNISAFSPVKYSIPDKVSVWGGFPLKDSALFLFSSSSYHVFSLANNKIKYSYTKNVLDQIDGFAKDEEKRVWFITRLRKLYRIEGSKPTDYSHLLPLTKHTSPLSISYNIFKKKFFLCEDSTLLYGDDKLIEKFIPANMKEPLQYCTDVLSTKSGKILLIVPSLGLGMIDEKNNFQIIIKRQEGAFFHADGLYESPEGDIWITDPGIGVIQYQFNNLGELIPIKTITVKDGLLGNQIYSIQFDFNQNIWVMSDRGLDIIRKNTSGEWYIFNYSKEVELQVDWQTAKLLTDASSNLLLISQDIIYKIDTRNWKLKKDIPRLVFEKVQLDMKDLNWSEYTDSAFSYRQLPIAPRFRFNKNAITIYFNGISFSSNPRIEYSYQLRPADTVWSEPYTGTSITYVKLPPGKYEFRVKTRESTSAWSEPVNFNFIIIKPYWMQWWFRILVIIVISGMIWLLFRYRMSQYKKLLDLRSKISRDLHDEIGSTLTSINILSRVSKTNLEKDQSKASFMLDKIIEQSETIQQSMQDIVWAIRPDNDRVENLIARMREYAGQTAEPRNMQVIFEVDEKKPLHNLSVEQRQNIFLIFKEAVNNAVKYSAGKTLLINFIKETNQLELIVRDDGNGFEMDKISTSGGLKNMKERARELNGELVINSVPGWGTEIRLSCHGT